MKDETETFPGEEGLDLLLAMLTALPDPVFVLTESGRYAALVGGQDRSLYHDGSHLVDFSLYDVLEPAKANWFLRQIRLTLQENCLRVVKYELAGTEVSGIDVESGPVGEVWFEGRIQPLPSKVNGERAVVWVASNITDRHNLEVTLQKLSETDELTGAYNRRKLLSALAQRLDEQHRYGTQLAFIIFDIDHFKQVNDRYGHPTGDQVLKQIVDICRETLRTSDMFARYGGEEFAIILPNTDKEHAYQAGERLRQRIENHRFLASDNQPFAVTISLGLCCEQREDTSLEDIIRRTDKALYRAKTKGRNQIETAEWHD